MKTIALKVAMLLWLCISCASHAHSQSKETQPKKNTMQTKEELNKEVIRSFYEMLNQRQTERIKDLVAEDYKNESGSGPDIVLQGALQLLKAFPDIQWRLEDVIAEGDNVVVRQKMTGTHREIFQNLPATGKFVVSEGFALYQFKSGKIVYHKVLTDGRSFLQQLGLLPEHLILQPKQ